MSVYFDTSTLVKLYVEEADSAEVKRLAIESESLATSVIAYAEAGAAFGRLRREEKLSASRFAQIRRELDEDWPKFVVVDVSDGLVHEAFELAVKYRLRGFDSVHLASYAELMRDKEHDSITFLSFDENLGKAARALASRMAGKKPAWTKKQEEADN